MSLRIKSLRLARGWTQDVLAAKARISRSQLAMIEKGTRPANTLRLDAIAKALDVAPEELFDSTPKIERILAIVRKLPDEDAETLLVLAEAIAAKAAEQQ